MTSIHFGVLLEGDANLLGKIATAFADPVWGIWLGRKTCIPTSPVLAGFKGHFDKVLQLVKENRDDALQLLIGNETL